MEKIYIVTANQNVDQSMSIVRVYRKLEDACRFIFEKTGMSENVILGRMEELGWVDAYDGEDNFYDISEHVLE